MAIEEEPRVCDPGGGGLVMPLGGEAEMSWDFRLRLLLYFTGLIYSFLGVSIVADMFMAAIERITSKQKKVKVPGTNRLVTVQVWNETVANLTLMALGSSAPEILLALNDVLKNEFFEGKLGPSTIVGSAAFNLFCIIAVCINSIPNGEIRQIKETGVFAVTAVWSIFAYLWMLFIVQFNSRDVIEVWEGVMTFFWFPILVLQSWATDSGLLTWESIKGVIVAGFTALMAYGYVEYEDEEEPIFSLFALVCGLSFAAALITWRVVKYCCCAFARFVVALCKSLSCCCRPRRLDDDDDLEEMENMSQAELHDKKPEIDDDLDDEIVDEDGVAIDNESGIMSFKADVMNVYVGKEERTFSLTVYRRNGDRGRVSVSYSMTGLTAVPGYDYMEEDGELNFRDSVIEQSLEFTVLPKHAGERNDSFQIVIEDETETVSFNPWHDGGEEKNILTVHITNLNPKPRTFVQRTYASFDALINIDEFKLGRDHWKEQISEAYYCGGSPEEQEQANLIAWMIHIIWLPWKLPFAIAIPPPVFLGGWICFVFSLLGIGMLTIIIGDLAELFGCVLQIDDAITAISIVAMGTSVPDLFASRTAAKADEYADASIVNVTGSNSVNVFLGIGVPWMIAAVYWTVNGANEKWTARYAGTIGDQWGANGSAVFVVRSGQLFFSVCVFTLAALVCLTTIVVRRRVFGGELGGPPDPKAYSSFLLILLWFFYISLSVWKLVTKTEDITTQIVAIVISIPILVLLMMMFAALVKALKVSKKYIGEEGFWGIFVAICIIGGRMLVFFGFQWAW